MTRTIRADAVVCTPMRVEQAALSRLPAALPVVRTGRGPRRSATWARTCGPGPRLVAGVGGAVDSGLHAGDLVVASEVVDVGPDGTPRSRAACPSAPLLAGALRRRGLRVHLGPVASTATVAVGPARRRLAATGVLAVDTESTTLVGPDGPWAVVRAIVDGPDLPLLSPGTGARGVRALRSLRAAAPALAEWTAALAAREVVLASPRSFCAGVSRAIDTVERALDRHGAPVYVRRQIVHNAHVVADLQRRGAVFVDELDEVPPGALVVLSAHGVAPSVRAEAAARGLAVVDATCPLVAKVHAEVRRWSRDDSVLFIGHADHEETIGTRGEAPSRVQVIEDEQQARNVRVSDPERVAYVMQTTLAVDEAEGIVDVLRERFPGLRGPRSADICYATTNRQRAVRALAARTDLVLVVGSANSSNSRRLVEVAERNGVPAALLEDAAELDLGLIAGVGRIGLTAGASAPTHLVDDVVHALTGLGPVSLDEEHVVDEDVRFTLPPEVS